MPLPESIFWTNESGVQHRLSGNMWDVDGRPVPDGDPIVNLDGVLAVKPGPSHVYAPAAAEAIYASYAGGRSVPLPELTAAIRSGRIDDVPGDE